MTANQSQENPTSELASKRCVPCEGGSKALTGAESHKLQKELPRIPGHTLVFYDMENAGATVVDEPDCVDGNMVSCRGWPDMPEWSRAFMNVLERAAVPA